jgi:hypothetical protein
LGAIIGASIQRSIDGARTGLSSPSQQAGGGKMHKLFAIAFVLAIAGPATAGEFAPDYQGRWGYLCMKGMQLDHVSGVCEKMTVPTNINDVRITKIDRVTADRACIETAMIFSTVAIVLRNKTSTKPPLRKKGTIWVLDALAHHLLVCGGP